MTQWEYCEVWWEPNQISVNVYSRNGITQQKHDPSEWPTVLAQLGADGWELTGVLPSSAGTHEYWYYFKRPLG